MRIAMLAAVTAAALAASPGVASAAQLFPSVPPPTGAHTELVSAARVAPDTIRYSYRYGPLVAAPGQNLVLVGPVTIERPPGEGFVTRVRPDLIAEDGKPPPVEQVHMHHAVFLNLSRRDTTADIPQRFYAFAEEKTIASIPSPYGYPVQSGDAWAINYMLHNETPQPRVVFVTYDVDFVPKASPTGLTMRSAFPVWMDVQNGKAYPVFDVHQGSGQDGRFDYPLDQANAYGGGPRLNEWTADRDMTLLSGAGHLHPGGLWVDLDVLRGGSTTRAFRSNANYFDPGGAVSWDLAMDYTPPGWRVAIKKGDTLRVSTTYDTSRASWYESMGIMLMYATDDPIGKDPFTQRIDEAGAPTHGHLPEDSNHGGQPTSLPDATKLPDGQTIQNGVAIANFVYMPGDQSLAAWYADPPVVAKGQSLRFGNFDSPESILHTVTACRQPCNGSTGISYPIANGPVRFDSGQLGYGPGGYTAAAQRSDWYTPPDLPPGTYTYFCRVHPFMRGSFRVTGPATPAAAKPGSASKPTIAILSKSLRMDRRGRVPVRLRCNGSGGVCRGTLQLAAVRNRKAVVLGKARFNVRAGHVTRVRVHLARSKRALVRHRKRVAVLARARPAGGGVTAGATLVLRAARR